MKNNIVYKFLNLLNKDTEYKESWKANIAMSYKDNIRWYKEKTGKKYLNSDDIHIISNLSAEHFLNLLLKNNSNNK